MHNEASGQSLRAQASMARRTLSLPDYAQRLPEPMRVSSAHGGSHPFLCNEFIAALLERRKPAIDVHEALALTVPGIVAYDSARRGGERVKIPSFV